MFLSAVLQAEERSNEGGFRDEIRGSSRRSVDTFIYITEMKRSDYCNCRRRGPTVVM